MIRWKIVFLIIIFTCNVHAYYLEGNVLAPDGSPVEGALVQLYGANRTEINRDYSNSKGEYRLSDLPGGSFDLEAFKFGYNKVKMSIFIGGATYKSTTYRDIQFEQFRVGEGLNKAQRSEFYLPLDHEIPNKAVAAFRKGMTYLEKGKVDKALKKFEKSVSIDETFSRGYTHIGVVYMEQEQFDDAMAAFDKAVELNPKDPLPLMNKGILYLNQKDYTNAIPLFKKATSLDPFLERPHQFLGEVYYRLEKWEEAEQELSQAALINPRLDSKSRILLGNIYVKLNRLADARDQYRIYLRDYPYSDNSESIKQQIEKIESLLTVYQMPDMK